MDDRLNPHAVACARCIKAAAKAIDKDEPLGMPAKGEVPPLMKAFTPTKNSPPPQPHVTVFGDGRDEEPEVVEAEVVEEIDPDADVEV